jgi:hypothetical protein
MTDQRKYKQSDVALVYERFGDFIKLKEGERKELYSAQEIEMLECLGKPPRQVEMEFKKKWKPLDTARTEAEKHKAEGKLWFIVD